jgi:hypothetical protein
MSEHNEYLLRIALSAAVPLAIREIQRAPGAPSDWHFERVREFGWELASSADDRIMYRSRKRGESAQFFDRFAETLAIMAFLPGGVKIFGMHFEVKE